VTERRAPCVAGARGAQDQGTGIGAGVSFHGATLFVEPFALSVSQQCFKKRPVIWKKRLRGF